MPKPDLNNLLIKLVQYWVILAVGVGLSAHIVQGISYETTESLVGAVFFLSLLNVFLRPLLVLFTLPFVVLTFGLGILVINGFLFYLVGRMIPGFVVESYWAAFGGGLIVSLFILLFQSIFVTARRS